MKSRSSAVRQLALILLASRTALAQPFKPPEAAPAPPPASPQPTTPAGAQSDVSAGLSQQLEIQRADLDEQDARIQQLEATVKSLSAELKKAHAVKAPPAPIPDKIPPAAGVPPDTKIKVSAYVQGQYENHQESEDQLAPGGASLNANRFVIRRARVKVSGAWKYSSVMIELDGNSVRGPSFGLQHAEASLLYRGERSYDDVPYAQLTFGLFDNPFGYEVLESPKFRPFMERTQISRGFFPAEPDLGARISGKYAFFRYSVAAVNGEPLGERTGYALQDPNNHKDIVGRVGVDVPVTDKFNVIGGVSVLNGLGFHPGSDNTKSTIAWSDDNENGSLTFDELKPTLGQVGLKSRNFKRWALNADLMFRFADPLGDARLYGEVTFGQNMDRGIFIADPLAPGATDAREFGYYVAVVHEVMKHGLVAFRFDAYDPNADFFDKRRGKSLPSTQTIRTFSPLVGFELRDHARLVFEYDVVRDHLARNKVGVPTDRDNNTWTLRLQGEL